MRALINSAICRSILLLAFTLCCAESIYSTTVIVPTDDDLIIGARAIVRGKVVWVECRMDRERIFTYVTLRVQEVIKGRIADRFITIKERGGQVGSEGSITFGSPRFSIGERVLLYLDTWPDGSLRVHQMFLGKFSIIEDATGRPIAVRETPDAHVAVLDASQETHGTITNRMELSSYIEMVRRRLAANRERAQAFERTYYRNVAILSAPPEYNRAASRALEPQFTFITNPPVRWFEPDDGQPVAFLVNPEGMPNPQVVDDITAAMNAWSSVEGCSLRLVNGGTTGACYARGINNIVFDNCDGQFAPSPSCSGVLAIGGLSWNSGETKVVNGMTFYRGHTGHISINPNATCEFADHCKVQEIVTHEMGHAVGLGHSTQFDATMFGIAHFDGRCASLRQDDIDGIRFIYPAVGGGAGPLEISSASPLAPGIVGRSYSQQLIARGGAQPYSWSLATGSALPAGLSLSLSGVISGTPSSSGTFSFTAQVRDSQSATAQKQLSITIASGTSLYDSQFIEQTVPTTVEPNQAFSVNMKWLNTGTETWDGSNGFRIGSQNPPNNVTWGGDRVPLILFIVPPGQTLDVTFTAFAPSIPGTYNFQWQLFQEGTGFFGQMSANVSVTVSGGSAPSITSSSSVEAMKGQPLTFQLTATGGAPPYTWSVASGALPAGLSLSANTGVIAGTPTDAGSSTAMIQVSDSKSVTAQKSLSITVALPPVEVMTAALPSVQRGSPYSVQLAAQGGRPPYAWSLVSGALPVGLTLAPATGILSGTPAAAGVFTFTVEAKDADSRAARKILSLTVTPPPVSLELASLIETMQGAPFSYQPAVAGGTPPYTWAITSGALPAGLALNSSTGLISGTPTASGLFTVGIAVKDQANVTAGGSFQIKVIDPETVPAIKKARYKAGRKKLIVTGERINPAATLVIDGNQITTSAADGQFSAKNITLASGRHELKIINPGGISSQPYFLTVD
ncbi:MAG TPA: putative Ig domain-containing protein [Blastocatellia bacterium]|nr:putative Ig domain-containing protein [Blastocatellia bacterium]